MSDEQALSGSAPLSARGDLIALERALEQTPHVFDGADAVELLRLRRKLGVEAPASLEVDQEVDPTVAACLIVRDASPTLAAAVCSVRVHVDEVCVFDTGSNDGTLELLEVLAGTPGPPIRVERGEWRDDFAWARERSFAMASAPWRMWLDADDVLENGYRLRGLLRLAGDAVCIVVQRVYRVHADGRLELEPREHLIHRDGGYRWVNRVHELCLPGSESPDRVAIVNPWALRLVHRPRWAIGEHVARNGRLLRLERVLGEVRCRALPDERVARADALFARSEWLGLGRNDPCWCGSGAKLKRCCESDAPSPPLVRLDALPIDERGVER